MSRLLVTGSRNWTDAVCVYQAIEQALEPVEDRPVDWMMVTGDHTIVHGGCPTGADFWASEWAIGDFANIEVHEADWKRYGRAAGPRRNAEMVDSGADICLAFIRDNSKGASHCARLAARAGIPVVYYDLDCACIYPLVINSETYRTVIRNCRHGKLAPQGS